LKDFDIAYDSLAGGKHEFKFEVGKELFEFFDHGDFDEINVDGHLTLLKEGTHLKLDFSATGIIEVECDRCGSPLNLAVDCNEDLIVKYSSKGIDANSDEIIYLSPSDTELNVAIYFYEMIVLSLPLKRIHDDDDCNPEVIERLNQWSVKEEDEIDPRWEALKKLK